MKMTNIARLKKLRASVVNNDEFCVLRFADGSQKLLTQTEFFRVLHSALTGEANKDVDLIMAAKASNQPLVAAIRAIVKSRAKHNSNYPAL